MKASTDFEEFINKKFDINIVASKENIEELKEFLSIQSAWIAQQDEEIVALKDHVNSQQDQINLEDRLAVVTGALLR